MIFHYTDLQQENIIFFQLVLDDGDGFTEGLHLRWKLFKPVLHSCDPHFFFSFHSCYSFGLFLIEDFMELLKLVLYPFLCLQCLILTVKHTFWLMQLLLLLFTIATQIAHKLPWYIGTCLYSLHDFFWEFPVYLASFWGMSKVHPKQKKEKICIRNQLIKLTLPPLCHAEQTCESTF